MLEVMPWHSIGPTGTALGSLATSISGNWANKKRIIKDNFKPQKLNTLVSEALKKSALALCAVFIKGEREKLETDFDGIDSPITEKQRLFLDSLDD